MPRPAFLLLGMAGRCWAGFFLPSTLLANGPHDVLALAISTYQSKPGHAVRLLAQSASAAAICATGFGQTFWLKSVADDPSRQEGFLAVPFTAAGGYHSLTLTVVAGGEMVHIPFDIEVLRPAPKPIVKSGPQEGPEKPGKISRKKNPRVRYRVSRVYIPNITKLPYSQESRRLRESRKQSEGFDGRHLASFAWPVKNGRVTTGFGILRVYNRGAATWSHRGIDIAAPAGTPILAPADGRVIFSEDLKANGVTTLVDHGYGVITAYLHQKQTRVHPGDVVRQGDLIGTVGSTGGSTGPHLHFQVNVNGVPVNPMDFLKGAPLEVKYPLPLPLQSRSTSNVWQASERL